MTTSTNPSLTKIEGIYRCSGDGQTKHFAAEEPLEPCSCGKGAWFCTVADNPMAEMDTVYVNSAMEAADTDEVPEVGNKLNIFGDTSISGIRDGLYEITGVRNTNGGPCGPKLLIYTKHIGPRDPKLRVHILSACGC